MKRSAKEFIPVMLTPFGHDGNVDYQGLTRLTEYYLKAGAGGLFANCLSSEMYDLSDNERLSVLKHILKVVDGAVPVVSTGTFENALEEQAGSIKRIYETGVKAVIVITCLLAGNEEQDEVFNERVFRLFRHTEGIPLGFYECPDPYKRVLSASQLKQFVETGRVIYHKDTCLDLGKIEAKLRATQDYDFGLYDAYMGHAVASLKAGAKGLSCIQGNYFPELIIWLCNNYDREDLREEVDMVQQFFIRNMDVMHTVYPVTAKYVLQGRGILKNTVTRRDVGVFNAGVKRDIDKLLGSCRSLMQEIEVSCGP